MVYQLEYYEKNLVSVIGLEAVQLLWLQYIG